MNRHWTLPFLGLCALAFTLQGAPVTHAQEAGDGPPPSGIVEEPQPGEDGSGRRLGNLPNDQIRQFQMRRACEEDLPECESVRLRGDESGGFND